MTDVLGRLAHALSDRYRIERELGAGGMATVYLAHDVRHDRKVAVKVLRPELSAILGGERFLAEIKTTANLQHPHILSLFDSGEADGLVFYVMPYVDGESLRDRLTRDKQLPVEEAVRIAREVADALEYAHQHKIVHRDIKPENILLHGGHAMVADFGIALAASRSDGGTRMTETGMSLGTPHYMAPEQAMGEKEITPRADIYALGCVLYEMLTAEPPFTGATAQAIIARVMTEEPRSLTLQRRTIPPHVEAAVAVALQKLPADRFATAAEFARALGDTGFATAAMPATRAHPLPRRGAAARVTAALPWVLVMLAAGGAAWPWLRRPAPVPRPVARFSFALPGFAKFNDVAGSSVAMSPDGAHVAYVGIDEHGNRQIFLRNLDALDPVPVPGSVSAVYPFFSWDSRWLAFVVGSRIEKVALSGGPVLPVATIDGGVFLGGSWGPNNVIAVCHTRGLSTVPAAGGMLKLVSAKDTSRDQGWITPDVLPDGRTALFFIRSKDGSDHPALVDLVTGQLTRYTIAGSNPHYITPGYVVLANLDGTLVAAPFDASRRRFTGDAVPLADGVLVGSGGVAKMGVSHAGSLVFGIGQGAARSVAIVDERGVAATIAGEQRNYYGPRYSPDGRRIALEIDDGSDAAIWVYDIAQKTLTRLTFDHTSVRPFWTPDGRAITYTSGTAGRQAVYRVAADGSAPPETLVTANRGILGDGWTEGGMVFVHSNAGSAGFNDIWIGAPGSRGQLRPWLATPADEYAPVSSPDGRWVAYTSNESGRPEVYARPFEGSGAKYKISLEGGTEPRWSPDGRRVVYRVGDGIVAATVRTAPVFAVTDHQNLFHGNYVQQQYFAQYDIAPDGRHLVMIQAPLESNNLMVVLNLFEQPGFAH